MLIHAGDFTNTGELEQVESFGAWIAAYPASHKIVIAGNHDTTFHEVISGRQAPLPSSSPIPASHDRSPPATTSLQDR